MTTEANSHLAEYYSADRMIKPGTVVEFGGNHEIRVCDKPNATAVAGVVTSDPAYIMNNKTTSSEIRVLVAINGRTPCKVIGVVKKGDLMIAAGGGYAKAVTSTVQPVIGSVLGKSLEDKAGAGAGVIEIAIGRA
jgi:hypothetical protein